MDRIELEQRVRKYLVKRRKMEKLTQAELGKRLGLPQPAISKFEYEGKWRKAKRLSVIEFLEVSNAIGGKDPILFIRWLRDRLREEQSPNRNRPAPRRKRRDQRS